MTTEFGKQERWRVGRKLGRTIYWDEQVVGMVDTPEIAGRIVAAMNGEWSAGIERAAEWLDAEVERAKQLYGLCVDDNYSRDLRVAWETLANAARAVRQFKGAFGG